MTEDEEEIMSLLVKAHNKYCKLEPTHGSDPQEWASNLHRLQNLIGMRVLRRDYPDTFITSSDDYEQK